MTSLIFTTRMAEIHSGTMLCGGGGGQDGGGCPTVYSDKKQLTLQGYRPTEEDMHRSKLANPNNAVWVPLEFFASFLHVNARNRSLSYQDILSLIKQSFHLNGLINLVGNKVILPASKASDTETSRIILPPPHPIYGQEQLVNFAELHSQLFELSLQTESPLFCH